MAKLVLLDIEGDLNQGASVTLEIREQFRAATQTRQKGKLPPNPTLLEQYRHWQSLYRSLDFLFRIEDLPGQVTNFARGEAIAACQIAGEVLKDSLNNWLNNPSFRPVREKLLEKLMGDETIQVILQVEDIHVRRLPWHLWDFFERYPFAEIALSSPAYERVETSANTRNKVRILAILGNGNGIDVAADRMMLEDLAEKAETVFLVEPQRRELDKWLWDEQGWDILFFAGHSASWGETGQIWLNRNERVTIGEIKHALKRAIARGLTIAIFNSCDGLGLAHYLENLQIPQIIVMREPVPDLVAQEFLQHFIAAFAGGKSLYLSVREAREKLQALETQFPGATWLPVICQNPSKIPPNWQELTGKVLQNPTPAQQQAQLGKPLWGVGFLLGMTLVGTSIFQWQQAELQKKIALVIDRVVAAKTLFNSEQALVALLESLRAGKQLQNLPGVNAATRIRVVTALQQELDGIRERNRLEGHGKTVLRVSFSPDGEMLASASDDRTVKLWQIDGKLLHTLEHKDSVRSVSFSPNGQIIASASYDGTIKLWRRNGQLLQTLFGHKNKQVTSVSFSPNGKFIASAGADNTVKLWRVNSTGLAMIPNAILKHRSWVEQVTFSPDGEILAAASTDKTIKLWRKDGTLLKTLAGHNGSVLSVSFSPDGEMLASASSDRTIKLWQTNGKLLQSIPAHDARVWSLVWRPDGGAFASAGADNTVKLWSRNGRLLQTFKGHTASSYSVSFSPDGETLASASADETIRFWHQTKMPTLPQNRAVKTSISFSSARILSTTNGDKTVKIWSRDGRLLKTWQGLAAVLGASFSPDGQILVSAIADKIQLSNKDGKPLHSWKAHEQPVRDVNFSQKNGKILASAAADNLVKLWRWDGSLVKILPGHQQAVNRVSFSPDGQLLASASDDNTIKLWGIDGKLLKTLEAHSSWVWDVGFSPDSQTMISASADGTAKLWSRDGELLGTLKGHNAGVSNASFSPDGQTIVTVSADGTVRLWSRDGYLLETIPAQGVGVWGGARFSPDGKSLVLASSDRIVMWSLDLDRLLERACDWLHDYLETNPFVTQSDRFLCQQK
jgi:WD40 repeat protein